MDVKVIQSTITEVKDINQTKAEIKVDVKSETKIIKEEVLKDIIEIKDTNTSQVVEKQQSDS